MGNDLRKLSPSALTILNNPAVIAINQDPLGRSATQIRRDTGVAKDKYGIGETQVWSGHLAAGDQVLVFLNAANEDVEMSASLEEIFYSDGPEGSAPQVHETWEVYDLWANRMEESVAQKILDSSIQDFATVLREANWYNATAIVYKDGLDSRDARLLGKRIGDVKPKGTLKSLVKRHSAEMFRLSNPSKNLRRYISYKDEL